MRKELKPVFTEQQIKTAKELSQKYIWWEKPEVFLKCDPLFILAQVMNLGTLSDWGLMLENFDKTLLVSVLKNAKKDGLMTRDGIFGIYIWVCVSPEKFPLC
ncbi:MAG: hypothetical protein KHX26_08335 [Burkholderiales bacterium]|nr:hypothetical protein [Burkholderiales bacterium]